MTCKYTVQIQIQAKYIVGPKGKHFLSNTSVDLPDPQGTKKNNSGKTNILKPKWKATFWLCNNYDTCHVATVERD